MLKKHLRKVISGAFLGLISAIVIWILAKYVADELLYSYEAKTYDWRVKKKIVDVPEQSIEDIVIVDIDGRSISKLGKFSQWQRSYYPKVIKFLNEGGAVTIGMDILFDRDIWHPEDDVEFVNTVAEAGNIYNALYFEMEDSLNWRYVMDDEPQGFEAGRFYYQFPLEQMERFRREDRFENEFIELLNASRGCGHVNFRADIDGVVRGIHLFTNFNNHLYPSLAFKMFLDLAGIDSLAINERQNMDIFREGAYLGEIPVDSKGNMMINYFGSFKTFRYISFYDVLKERLPMEYFQDKIVLIGTTVPGLYDLRSVPFMQAFPGVEIHANLLYTLLQQNFVHHLSNFQTFLIMIALGVILGVLLSYAGPVLSILLIFAVGFGHVIITSVLLMNNNLWVEMITPLLTIFLTFTAVYMYRYMTEEKKKRFIRTTFSRFVTKSVVDELLANPEKIKLGGEKKNCTVLFSDVAGFTTISEQLSPEELVHLLNAYLTEMTNIVFKYDGMLDKYEGDAIMAVFGAPVSHGNHAYNACATAIDMQIKLAKMRKFWRKQGKPELTARIGVNTGPMVVGNMGSETRFDYTVMGDAVNLGARLEPANKEYGSMIMIGQETCAMAGDKIITRALDLLRVKGKTEPVKVYELLGTTERGVSDDMMRILEFFQQGFNSYLKQDWDLAINYFEQALSIKTYDGPSKRYLQRCHVFKENPPGDGWDGVFVMTTK
jgi:adenylate cyclase